MGEWIEEFLNEGGVYEELLNDDPDPEVMRLIAELVIRCEELGWLPHAHAFEFVNGALYRVEVKRVED